MSNHWQRLARTTLISKFLFIAMLSLGLVALVNTAWADVDKPHHAAHSLAKDSQNPVSSLISVPFENNATFNNGRTE